MAKSMFVLLGFASLSMVLAACSGAEDGGSSSSNQKSAAKSAPAGSASSADQTAPGPDSSAVDCVPAGTKGNSKGIGAYCQGASECSPDTFCTAGLAPKGAEYCTAFCSTDADCGEGATCYTDPRGKACAPTSCLASRK